MEVHKLKIIMKLNYLNSLGNSLPLPWTDQGLAGSYPYFHRYKEKNCMVHIHTLFSKTMKILQSATHPKRLGEPGNDITARGYSYRREPS